MTENINEAQRYADSIAEGLNAWQLAAEYIEAREEGNAECEITGEILSLREWADALGRSTTGLNRPDWIDRATDIALDELNDHVQTVADAWSWYIGTSLCVEVLGKHDGSEWTATGVEVTVTAGGPSCWIEWDGSDCVRVRAAWGSDCGAAVVTDCADLCAALEGCMEVVS